MVDGVSAVTADIQNASNKADEVGAHIEGLMRGLMNELSHMDQAWLGMAGVSFGQLKTAVDAETMKLKNALHAIGEDLGCATNAMIANDEDMNSSVKNVSAQVTGITSSLNA